MRISLMKDLCLSTMTCSYTFRGYLWFYFMVDLAKRTNWRLTRAAFLPGKDRIRRLRVQHWNRNRLTSFVSDLNFYTRRILLSLQQTKEGWISNSEFEFLCIAFNGLWKVRVNALFSDNLHWICQYRPLPKVDNI